MPNAKRVARRVSAARRSQILAAVLGTPWAITPAGLEVVLARTEQALADPAAIDAKPADDVERSWQMTKRDGVAQLRLYGPLVSADSWMRWYFASYADIARELHTAMTDPSISALVLTFASPGGHVAGCDELAQIIAAARGAKPIVAYVEGDACSAAYWLASACDEIVTAETGVLGCLGVQVAYLDATKYLEEWGLREIVITSSQTPEKNRPPVDDDGRAAWQQMVDDLADVFLTRIAANLGTARETVDAQFGRGAVLVAKRAVAAGMAARVGTYEMLHAELAGGTWRAPSGVATPSATGAVGSPHQLEAGMTKTKTKPGARTRTPANVGRAAGQVPAPRADSDTPKDPEEEASGDEEEEPTSADEGGDEEEDEEDEAPAASRAAADVKAERARVTGILALSDKAPMATLQQFIAQGVTPEQAAHQLLTGKAKGLKSSALANLAADEAAIAGNGGLSATAAGESGAAPVNPLVAALRATNPRALVSSPAHGVRVTTGA
jgi:ClpP class serine protease